MFLEGFSRSKGVVFLKVWACGDTTGFRGLSFGVVPLRRPTFIVSSTQIEIDHGRGL